MPSTGAAQRGKSLRPNLLRGYAVHSARVALLVFIVLLIRSRYVQSMADSTGPLELPLQQISQNFPTATALRRPGADGSQDVVGKTGEQIGTVLQTSPQSDHIVGFSGSTNVIIAFDDNGKILGTEVLSSQDTRDHVEEVVSHPSFLDALNGLTREDAAQVASVDAVSGATLTSLAIREAIIHRLGGDAASLRFPEALTPDDVKPLFPQAAVVKQEKAWRSLWPVLNAGQSQLGWVLRTSPAADNVIGYQGPTDTLIGLDSDNRVTGIAMRKSYDNEPYTKYVRQDRYFTEPFIGLSLEELANFDLKAAEVEGVSGATMTSLAVADGLLIAAQSYVNQQESSGSTSPLRHLALHDWGTLAVILASVMIGMTSLRSIKSLRVAFQIILIGYLGLTAGNLVSQAMLVGWAQHGVAWKSAPGLVMLTIAALALPIGTRRNLYCTHLCPHGAAQQLLKGRGGFKLRLPAWLQTLLKLVPALLLGWCLIVGMTSLGFSLVDIEAFDAYLFRIAGWAAIVIAVGGLIASLFIPMAYCRYGCPTGLLLEYLRFNARSDRWTVRDWTAVGFLLIACFLRMR